MTRKERRIAALRWSALMLMILSGNTLRAEIDSDDPYRLDTNVVPSFQSVTLTLDADRADYSGSTVIGIEIGEATDRFRFHAEDMTLSRVVLRGNHFDGALRHESGEEGLVTVFADRQIPAGPYELFIDFTNDFGMKGVGLYRVEQDGQGYAFTQFQAIDAREAFPCWDEPAFKITWDFTIAVPEDHIALTNTPVKKEDVQNGWRRSSFETTPPLPSYLIAIATGPFKKVPIEGMSVPGHVVVLPGQEALAELAVDMTPPLLAALEDYFEQKYPFRKLDLIAVPEYWFGAMENPGLVTFLDSILLVDPDAASVQQQRTLARVISHELAHMWFGDLVTMQWWDDLWLNESFADWAGDKIAERVYPQLGIGLNEFGSSLSIMRRDALASSRPVQQRFKANDDFTQNIGVKYSKGKAVLAMFEQSIGAEEFRRGVLAYLDEYKWSNATSDDLWQALSKASGTNISDALATFIEQPGLPLITVTPTDNGVEISQQRFANAGVDLVPMQWQIPVTLRYSDGRKVRTKQVELDQGTQEFALKGKTIRWIYPNASGAGYYRWRVPEGMLLEMAAEADELLNVRERMAYLSNLSALLDAADISGSGYLSVLREFGSDSSPAVLSSLIEQLDKVEPAFSSVTTNGAFKLYVVETLAPAIARFGLKKKEGEADTVTLTRPALLQQLGIYAYDPVVLEYADTLAQAYMTDPDSIDPSLAGIALQLAAMNGDKELFDAYRRHFEEAQIPVERRRYLTALGAFRDPGLYTAAMDYVFAGPLRSNERRNLMSSLWYVREYRDHLFAWIMENYDDIKAAMPPEYQAIMPLYAGGCSAARLALAQGFFSSPDHSVAGTAARLERLEAQVTDCLRLREREEPAVQAYLNGLEDEIVQMLSATN